jgi:hypothetical protein
MSWTYDVNAVTGNGGADGSMTIVGSGTLSQGQVNAAIANYNATPGQTIPLTSVVVAGTFTFCSDNTFASNKFTSIVFSADSEVTGFGFYPFNACTSLTKLVLPPKLIQISHQMCLFCSSLKTVVIPESVTSFHSNGYGFYGCSSLEHIVIPSSVTSLPGGNDFYSCPKLVSIEFLNPSLTSVASNTFAGTNNIRFMKLSTSLWNNIRSNNTNLRPILQFHGETGYKTWNGASLLTGNGMTLDNGNLSGNYDGTLTINQNGALVRSSIDTYISRSSPYIDLVVTLGSEVTELDTGVFSGLTGLTEVKFNTNNAVTTFNARSFQGCTALKTFIIPSGVINIGDKVFQGCTLLEDIDFPEGLTTLGTAIFEDCTSLQDIVFPQGLNTISGTAILAGVTSIRTLKMHESIYEKMSLVENKDHDQLVQFYGENNILEPLKTQVAYWDGLEGTGGANAKGYKNVIDYYSTSGATYTTVYSGGTTATLVNYSAFGDMTYDVSTDTLSGRGTYDGSLTILGTGELTQTTVDAAISAHTSAQNGKVPLHTLTVGPDFTSLETSLSLQGTSITDLIFPAESLITTTGAFELAIDSTLATTVVLPKWVVQQGGPWSLN